MASCASTSFPPPKNTCPSVGVLVSNDLMELIKEEKGERESTHTQKKTNIQPSSLTTMDELMGHLKDYIMKHQLYDPTNPVKVILKNNQLGCFLGKNEFFLSDVRDILLEKCVFPLSSNASEVLCSIKEQMRISKKRKLDLKNDSEISTKKINTNCFDSDENIHSYEDPETEFVKDCLSTHTDGDNFSRGLIIAETYDFDVEYEIETGDESGELSESDSDLEDFVKSAIITFIAETTDSDIEYLADRSSDEESEISEEDRWKCIYCATINEPITGCCCGCFKTRVGWRSEREQREESNRRNRYRAHTRNTKKSKRERKLSKRKSNNINKGSSNCKLSDLPSATPTEGLSSPSTSCNADAILCQSPSNTLENKTRNDIHKQLCLFCCTKPADSTIIHGKIGCNICCFSCGLKISKINDRCPVCRRTIDRVVYVYNL